MPESTFVSLSEPLAAKTARPLTAHATQRATSPTHCRPPAAQRGRLLSTSPGSALQKSTAQRSPTSKKDGMKPSGGGKQPSHAVAISRPTLRPSSSEASGGGKQRRQSGAISGPTLHQGYIKVIAATTAQVTIQVIRQTPNENPSDLNIPCAGIATHIEPSSKTKLGLGIDHESDGCSRAAGPSTFDICCCQAGRSH